VLFGRGRNLLAELRVVPTFRNNRVALVADTLVPRGIAHAGIPLPGGQIRVAPHLLKEIHFRTRGGLQSGPISGFARVILLIGLTRAGHKQNNGDDDGSTITHETEFLLDAHSSLRDP
jgi:hypothetical protein